MLERSTNIISTIAGSLARIRLPAPLDILSVRIFASLTGADPSEAEFEISRYRTISEFFTRALRPGLRQAASAEVVSPVDGVLRQAGKIEEGKIPQVKGRDYLVSEFLGGVDQARVFRNGHYYNFYLAPRNYHHVHAPFDCTITSLLHIPGSLFPVNDLSLKLVDKLFCRNERVVVFLESRWGRAALVFVGALNVGSIVLAFDRLRTNIGTQEIDQRVFAQPIPIKKCQHLGGFGMGSSVVVILDRGFGQNIKLLEQEAAQAILMGEAIC